MSRLATPYVPRRPQETVLFVLVQEHLQDFFRHARESYDGPLPKYVKDEFRKYPECGDFSRGFVHVQCPVCHEDEAVAFSCKLRGLCPSCAGRRMAGTAAHLVDCVLPAVPVRQYVLAFPYELSGLAATRPEVLRATPASMSPTTMISHASDCAATSRVRPSRSRAWACVATASWCTA